MRRDKKVSTEAAEFLSQTVADIEGNTERRGSDGHAHGEGGHAEDFAPGAAGEGVGYESEEHWGVAT